MVVAKSGAIARFYFHQNRMQWHLNYAVVAVVIPSFFFSGYSIIFGAAVVTGERANGILPKKIQCIYLFSVL